MKQSQVPSAEEPAIFPMLQQRDRWMVVREAQEMLDLNNKIQAAIIRNRLDQHSLLSQHLKSRELGGKVKRAVEMRQKFAVRHERPPEGSFTTSVTSNGASNSLKNRIDDDFDVVLDASLSKLSYDRLKNSEKSQLLNEISEEVKNRLISHYAMQAKRLSRLYEPSDGPCEKNNSKPNSTEPTIAPRRSYQTRPLREQRRYDSISSSYEKALDELKEADRFRKSQRKEKHHRLYSQVRNPKHYYQLIGKVRCLEPLQSHSVDLAESAHEIEQLLALSNQ